MIKDWVKEVKYKVWDNEYVFLLDNNDCEAKKKYCVLKEIMSNDDDFIIEEYDSEKLSIVFKYYRNSSDNITIIILKDSIYLIHHSISLTQCVLELSMGRSDLTYYEILCTIGRFFSDKFLSPDLCTRIYLDDLNKIPELVKKAIIQQNKEILSFLRLVDKVKKYG